MTEPSDAILLREVTRCWTRLGGVLVAQGLDPVVAESAARRAVQIAAFLGLAGTGDTPCLAPALLWVADVAGEPFDDAALWMGLSEAVRAELVAAFRPFLEPRPSAEILGRIHEQLLGRRLTVDRGGCWKAVGARGPRRSAGVFYTPPQVATYITRCAVVDRAQPLSVLDPACGGGAFLLAAVRCAGGAVELHGVDLDPEAILTTRRALWLECAALREMPNDAAWLERIRVADAISDPRLDAARGRFDAVIGNPPYRRELGAQGLLERLAQTALGRRCRTARMDLWYYFLHRGLELLRPGGRLGYIVGAYWTAASGAAKLVAEIRDSAHVEEIVCLPPNSVFPQVGGRHLIVSLVKEVLARPTIIRRPSNAECHWEELLEGRGESFFKSREQLFRSGKIDLEPACDEQLAALDRWPALGQLGLVRQGIAENPARVMPRVADRHAAWRPGEGVFVLGSDEAARLELTPAEIALLRPYHVLAELGRYWLADRPAQQLIYSTAQTWPDADRFPRLLEHLARFRPLMEARRETRLGRRSWWHLHWPREESIWQTPKLVAVQMGPRPALVPALGPAYVPFSVNVFLPARQTPEHLYYLAGLLNSRLLWQWFRHHAKCRGVGLEINGHVLAAAPIRRVDWTVAEDRQRHDALVDLVGQRLELERQRRAEATPDADVERVEQSIDRLVSELYGLECG